MNHMDDHEDKQIPTIFHDILLSKLPPAEKKLDRIYQEGQTLVAAGTETTAWTLSVIMFYLLNDPAKLQRLTNELRKANATTSTELEQLPYLNGVVQEGLRLGLGVSHRLPRIAPDEALAFVDGGKTWLIPPGVSRCLAFVFLCSADLLRDRPRSPCPQVFCIKTPKSSLLHENSGQNAGSTIPLYLATLSRSPKVPVNAWVLIWLTASFMFA
jgi:cytochrome P450